MRSLRSDQVNYTTLHNGLTVATCNLEDYFECALTCEWYHIGVSVGGYMDSEELISEAAITEFDLVLCDEKTYYIKRSDMPVDANTEDQIEMELVA